MITGWLLKLVLGIALFGFIAYEVGTPLIVRAQLDGVAQEAAVEAAAVVRNRGGSVEAAQAAAAERAAADGAELKAFTIDDQKQSHVTVRKEAKSYLFKKWGPMKSWYDVTVSASSQGRR